MCPRLKFKTKRCCMLRCNLSHDWLPCHHFRDHRIQVKQRIPLNISVHAGMPSKPALSEPANCPANTASPAMYIGFTSGFLVCIWYSIFMSNVTNICHNCAGDCVTKLNFSVNTKPAPISCPVAPVSGSRKHHQGGHAFSFLSGTLLHGKMTRIPYQVKN